MIFMLFFQAQSLKSAMNESHKQWMLTNSSAKNPNSSISQRWQYGLEGTVILQLHKISSNWDEMQNTDVKYQASFALLS